MEIVDNAALLFQLKNPTRVTAVIPKSKVLGEESGLSKVLVHWGLEETQVLRNLGFKDVPSPILGRYGWPGMYKPFAHQRTTSAFLTLNRRAFLLSEPGTGKTMSVAWSADYLLTRGLINRVLIICPLSIMQAAWQNDLFKSVMHRKVGIAHGSRNKRVDVINGDAEYVIINFDGIESVLKELQDGGFDLVVIDEANAIKTHTTKRWKAINALVRPDTWLWMMTGTPASQSPTDAYGLARMMNPNSVPKFFGSFRDQVQWKVTQFKYANKPDCEATVHKVLQPAIRFTKEECLDLPELLYTSRDVEMTDQQKKYYNQLKKSFYVEAAGTTISAVNAATNLNKMLQVACGSAYTDEHAVVDFDITPRYNELLGVIQESTQKVLVFVPFKHTISRLHSLLMQDGITTEVIHGGVSATARNDIFQRFQLDPDPRVLVIQPAAASHGVTLHAANTVVWWSAVTSYETYAQANARVHRAGQRHPCLVVRLCGSGAERGLYKALDSREVSQVNLLSLYQSEIEET